LATRVVPQLSSPAAESWRIRRRWCQVANCFDEGVGGGLVSSTSIRSSQVPVHRRQKSVLDEEFPQVHRVPGRCVVIEGGVGQRTGAGGDGGQQIADVRVAQPGQRAAGMGLGNESLVQGSEGFSHVPGSIVEEFRQVIAQAAAGAAPGPVGFFLGRTLDAAEVRRDADAVGTGRGSVAVPGWQEPVGAAARAGPAGPGSRLVAAVGRL
jgi:hypothetical protein